MQEHEEKRQDQIRLNFENEVCVNQKLSFESLRKEFQSHNLDFTPAVMMKLKLTDSRNRMTNLAYLLSEQCDYSIKMDVFKGNNYSDVSLHKEFSGGVVRQFNELIRFFDANSSNQGSSKTICRIAQREFPLSAIKEALSNMMIHRNYSYPANAFIRVFDDRIEFVSLGGLVSNLTLDDIRAGISVNRNPDLAHVFNILGYSDNSGLGIGKIESAYQNDDVRPAIELTPHTFKAVLPRLNPGNGEETELDRFEEIRETEEYRDRIPVTKKVIEVKPAPLFRKELSDEEMVLEFAKSNGSVSRNEVIELLKTSTSTANRVLKRLVLDHKLQPQGKARSTSYTIIE